MLANVYRTAIICCITNEAAPRMISVVLLRCGVEVVGWLRECLWILHRKLLGTFAKTADSGALGFLLELGSLLFPCVLYLRFHLTLG